MSLLLIRLMVNRIKTTYDVLFKLKRETYEKYVNYINAEQRQKRFV